MAWELNWGYKTFYLKETTACFAFVTSRSGALFGPLTFSHNLRQNYSNACDGFCWFQRVVKCYREKENWYFIFNSVLTVMGMFIEDRCVISTLYAESCFCMNSTFFFFFFLFQCRLASHFLQIATANCHCHSLNNSCRRPCLSIYSCPILLSDYCWWQISVRIACFWQCSVPDIAGLVLSAPILCRY